MASRKHTGLLYHIRSVYPNHGRPWDGLDDKNLTAFFNRNLTVDEISKAMGRSPNSILAHLNDLDLVERRPEQITESGRPSYSVGCEFFAKKTGEILAAWSDFRASDIEVSYE